MSAAALAVAMAALAGGAAPAAPRQTAIQEIAQAVEKHDCAKILKLGEPLLADRQAALPEELEAGLAGLIANCADAAGARDKAYGYVMRATRLAAAPDELWQYRLSLELDTKRYAAAVATVEAMSQGRGAALNATPMELLFWLSRALKEGGLKAERQRLFKVLAADGYAPVESAGDAQSFQLGYARMLAEQGQLEAARPYVARISDGRVLSEIYVDPQLRTLLPPAFDLRAAAEAGAARDREAWERHPDKLALLVRLADDLRRLGRPQEAIALLQAASGRIADSKAFADAADQLPWYWDILGRAHGALGHYDEAVKAFSAGAALKEGDTPNVSQVINLAHMQVRYRHHEEALKTLAVFGQEGRKASPYGEMELRTARVCAQAGLGRAAAAAEDLAYAQAHEKDNPDALGYIYLCLGRDDDAAAFFIRRLSDPETRTEILRQMSDFDPPPGPVPSPFGEALARLKARPDVKGALERAGGIRRIPLQAESI